MLRRIEGDARGKVLPQNKKIRRCIESIDTTAKSNLYLGFKNYFEPRILHFFLWKVALPLMYGAPYVLWAEKH